MRVKRPQLEANHSSPAVTEIRHEWSYTPVLIYALTPWSRTKLPFCRVTVSKKVSSLPIGGWVSSVGFIFLKASVC